MARYGQAMKDRVVARLLPPESLAIEALRQEAEISVAALDEAGQHGWCREHELYRNELEHRRQGATDALADSGEARARRAETQADRKRIKELEREIPRASSPR